MGHIIHHSIIATTYDEVIASKLLDYCKETGASAVIVKSSVNDYTTVFVGTDGSKSRWPESDRGDLIRKKIKEFIRSQNFEDGSNPFEWLEVSYSSDDGEAKIIESQWESNVKTTEPGVE